MSFSTRVESAPQCRETQGLASDAQRGSSTSQRERVALPQLRSSPPAESIRNIRMEMIPEQLLASLTSAVCTRDQLGSAHHKHGKKEHRIPRPDAVWNYPLGLKKYGFFLDQPTSLNGAGRDISFLCDAMATQRKMKPLPPVAELSDTHTQDPGLTERLIPEEYHMVKNKGLQALKLYSDKFTVQLRDDKQRLRSFPSLRPSGRLEVVQLMEMMDEMLEKAGVNKPPQELSNLSQMQALLELVQEEQNIYNLVFHELIRQASVECAERGQLLAKLRQRYASLLERVPTQLKALHTETVARRALDRRLIEEILCFKTSIQQLHRELSEIRAHDETVTQQAEQTQGELAEALYQAQKNADLLQDYHDLYEMKRRRAEVEVEKLAEERDLWRNVTYSLALKIIRVKKIHVASRLHVSKQAWSKRAKHLTVLLSFKDTEDLNIVMAMTDKWKDQLSVFMSTLRQTEHAQCQQIYNIQDGITKWLAFCSKLNQNPNSKYESVLEEICADLKKWSNMLTVQCERYGGEQLLSCQELLEMFGRLQDTWVNSGLRIFRRHPGPDGAPPGGQEVMREMNMAVTELHKQLGSRVKGEKGVHVQIMSLAGLMESWATNLRAEIGRPHSMKVSNWLKLEKALCGWQSQAEGILQTVSRSQSEHEKENSSHDTIEMEDVFDTIRQFITSQSNFLHYENNRLSEEVYFLEAAQTRWMADLLILMPDHSQDQDLDLLASSTTQYAHKQVSLETLEQDARSLAQKLHTFSSYITSSCQLIPDEELQKSLPDNSAEGHAYERNQLQRECSDWVDTCEILLSDMSGGPLERSVKPPGTASHADVTLSPGNSPESPVAVEVSPEPVKDVDIREESQTEVTTASDLQGEPPSHQTEAEAGGGLRPGSVLKLIDYDGIIAERMLGESSVTLVGTEDLVSCPTTDNAQKAFDSLATVEVLQRELHSAVSQVQRAEQRALRAEEALQEALVRIQDLERQLPTSPRLKPKETKKHSEPAAPVQIRGTSAAKKSRRPKKNE